jgi:kynureninase
VSRATALDAADPLAGYRERFVIADDDVVYLDGNSLGRMPEAAAAALERASREEWGDGLVRSWHDWIDLPGLIGADIARIVGAAPNEVVMSDQTSINLYKLASAAVTSQRPDIVTDTTNFPSDIYVLRAIAERAGGRLRLVASNDLLGPTPGVLAPHLDASVGLVSVSHVAFKSGAITDLAAVTALAHEHGAMVLFDCSHSIGAIPIELAAVGADLAIGCTYKHCNGGPGAPAFLYVRSEIQDRLTQPIHGWWGHDAMFEFSTAYQPAADIRRFLTGTPAVLSMRAAQPGIAMIAEGHRITKALIARNVIPDFRAPDNIRLGISPLYQRHVEMGAAVEALADVVRSDRYRDFDTEARVT